MKNIMQTALGESWNQLPPGLKAHYQGFSSQEDGFLNIEYPKWMQPYLTFLRLFGALVNRAEQRVATRVIKEEQKGQSFWRRTMTFSDGRQIKFNSRWVYAGGNEVLEYVNPWMALRMSMEVKNGELYYEGLNLIIQLGRLRIPVPEWLVLGHTSIRETALENRRFAMDFRMTHPWFGEVFRYAGEFVVSVVDSGGEY